MPLYEYSAVSGTGVRSSGSIDAGSLHEAKERLRSEGLMLTAIHPARSGSAGKLSGEALLSFTTLLSQLVDAGVPLYESLMAIQEQYREESYHTVLSSLCEQIKRGKALSEAMEVHPSSFDMRYRSMVSAGEASGALSEVLNRLTALLSKQQKLTQQIRTAMIYPAVLAVFSMAVIVLLLTFVVPSLEALFEGRRLNAFTTIVLSVSAVLRGYWWLYFPLIIAGGLGAWWKLRSDAGVYWLQKTLLRLPVIKTAVAQAALARFCRTMGTLLQGGVTLIEALRISRGVMHNRVLEEEMQRAEEQVVQGGSLSVQLSRSDWIPQMVPRMLGVGEEAGALGKMFHKVADLYEDELEKTLTRVIALAQPVILIVMGSIIGLILMAILLPLTDVAALMG